jgi:hypothetical protein
MKKGQITARLSPVHGGAYTRFQLSGSVPTAIARRAMKRLVCGLSFWSGWPVECVLCVDRETASWCEWWSEVLGVIPEHHLKVQYRQKR